MLCALPTSQRFQTEVSPPISVLQTARVPLAQPLRSAASPWWRWRSTTCVRAADSILCGQAEQKCISAGLKLRPYFGRSFGPADDGHGSTKSGPNHMETNEKSTFWHSTVVPSGAKNEAGIRPRFWSREIAPLVDFFCNTVCSFLQYVYEFSRAMVANSGAPARPPAEAEFHAVRARGGAARHVAAI